MADELHVKHRPRTWDDMLGQDATVKSVRDVVKENTCHSFIFTGPSGVGKTTLARIVASEVGCSQQNLREIDAATNTGVDAMRAITDTLSYRGLGASATKVTIVDEAHRLSSQAWDSLLKSVEEPPDHVYWIFCTTEPHKIPATIKTRCVCYELKSVAQDLLYELLLTIVELEKMEVDDDVAFFCAQKADGSPRRAITNLSACRSASDRKEAAAVLRTILEDDDIIDLCKALMDGKPWVEIAKMLAAFKEKNEQPESLRIVIANYFAACALRMKSNEKATGMMSLLEPFADPFPAGSGFASLVFACGEAVLLRQG